VSDSFLAGIDGGDLNRSMKWTQEIMTRKLTQTLWFRKLAFGVLFTLFAILFASLAYKGFFSRYLQDDYCYGSTIREQGFLAGVVYPYFHGTEYNGNRYALTLFAGITEVILGTRGQLLYSLLSLLAWASSLAILIHKILKMIQKKNNGWLSIFLAAVLVTFTCYLAPDLYQSLYWRNSSLTYLWPIIMFLFVLGGAVRAGEKNQHSFLFYLGLFLSSVLAAGFSETAAVWQISIIALVLIFSNLFLKNKSEVLQNNRTFLTVLAGTLAGAALLIISPVNSTQLQGPSTNMASFPDLIQKSLRFGFDFLRYSIAGKWLPFSILFLFGFFIVQFVEVPEISIKSIAKMTFGLCVSLYLLSVASMTPSVLVRTAYPDPRAQLIPHFTLILTIYLLGTLAGCAFSSLKLNRFTSLTNLLMAALFVGLAFYSARMIPLIHSDDSVLQARAVAWDQRQALIEQEKSAGELDITVPAFDNIDKINELHLERDHWVNICAARYYGVNSISAVENYDGVKPYFK
jgi:hypothetical protein